MSDAIDNLLGRKKQGSGKVEDVSFKYAPYVTSLSSAQSGKDNYTSTLWISKRPSIASTETVFGKYCALMGSQMRLLFSSKAPTTTSHAKLGTATSALQSRQE